MQVALNIGALTMLILEISGSKICGRWYKALVFYILRRNQYPGAGQCRNSQRRQGHIQRRPKKLGLS